MQAAWMKIILWEKSVMWCYSLTAGLLAMKLWEGEYIHLRELTTTWILWKRIQADSNVEIQ